jgi:hypothetical protein
VPVGGTLSSRAAESRVERLLAVQVSKGGRLGVAPALKRGVRAAARFVAAFPGAPPPLPSKATGRATLVAVVMLHETLWPNWEVWAAWEALHGGAVAVYCHLKAKLALPNTDEGRAIGARLLKTRKLSKWGKLSLTGAWFLDIGVGRW